MFGTARAIERWKRVPAFLSSHSLFLQSCLPIRFFLGAIATAAVVLVPGGCTTEKIPINSTSLTGNWVLETTSTTSTDPFTSLAGFINQETQNYSASNAVTAALEAEPNTCYLGADLIPLEGSIKDVTLGLYSFDVNGQYLSINATSNSAGNQLTGTYSVSGGCAAGAAGTFTGTRYDILTGTYSGAFAASTADTVQMTLKQNVLGTGSGNFFVSGTATFGGISCFTSGTMSGGAGSIIGNAVQLDFTASDGSQVLVSGTIDPTASTFTVSAATVSGGNCDGSLGQATLTVQ